MRSPADPYRIFVYGYETKGLAAPKENMVSKKYSVEFHAGEETPRFDHADGVIVFQGSFESFKRESNGFHSYLKHQCNRDELDKRTKETLSLIENDGFVGLLLTEPFIEFEDRRDFRQTDLSKRLLSGLTRENFGTRTAFVRSKVNELEKFFATYGAAWTSLRPDPGDAAVKTLATSGRTSVSIVTGGRVFAIPTLVPRGSGEAVEEYFETLLDGLVPLWERLRTDLPDWAHQYRFSGEAKVADTKIALSAQISTIDEELRKFERFKRVLVLQSEALVDAVAELFEKALPLKPKREEAFREDLILMGPSGNQVALAEIKGVNRGVAREHVNQADSHRERNGLPAEFPSILIVNTAMKASSLIDKDQPVAPEQVQHAARNNILIVRTLDLLNLASLYVSGELTSELVVSLLTESRGWLKVEKTVEVVTA